MLSAIIVIGACVMVLAAVCGAMAVVLMFLNRVKLLLKALRECGFTPAVARNGFHAMVADARARSGRYLLGVAIFCSFALFAEYILLGLVALGTLAIPLSAICRWRGFGSESHTARYQGYALFVDESHHATGDAANGRQLTGPVAISPTFR